MVRALKFIDRYGGHIAAQVATRRPELPNSTGAVEADIRELDKRIGDRAACFTNRARTTKLLDLITADLRRPADGRRWADVLRERVHLAGGHPWPQRPHDDPRDHHSLYA
jgi:hypothetical protein